MNHVLLFLVMIIGSFFFTANVFAQQSFEDIKNDTINDKVSNAEYMKNIELLKGDQIDSIDIKILQNPMMISQIMVKLRGKESITYGGLKSYYLEIKNNTNVQRLRVFYETVPILKQTIVDSANWEHDQQYVNRLIKDEEQLNKIEQYVDQYTDSNVTYIELLALLEQQEQQKEPVGLHDLLHEYHIAKIDSLIQLSTEHYKPILLYFSGHNVVNARKLEMRVMNEQTIIDHLLHDFIFVNLLVDDRTEIPKDDQYFSNRFDKKVTTVGAFNMDYQLKRFNLNRQPFLVVLDSENDVLGTRKYKELQTSEDLKLFLEEVLEEYSDGKE